MAANPLYDAGFEVFVRQKGKIGLSVGLYISHDAIV